jgi:pimeloyl-[acyl-carrier protein] synthase
MENTIGGIWSDKYQSYCEGRLHDPYPLFAWLLEHRAVHWSEPMKSWFVVRYADVINGLQDPRMSSDRAHVNMNKLPPDMQKRFRLLGEHVSNWLGFRDEPRHMEVRRLLGKVFTLKEAQAAEGRIRLLSEELVSKLRNPRAELMEELAHPLPLTVVSDLLGIPVEDRNRFKNAVNDIGDYVAEAGPNVVAAAERAHAGVEQMTAYFKDLIARCRREPTNGLVTQLATTMKDAIDMTLEEILGLCVFIFAAGHETSQSLIGSSALLLLQHQENIARLQENPALMPTAVEEFLRFESPIMLMSRVAREKIEIGGQDIPAGDTVTFCLAAANRDPLAFPNPNELLIDRTPNKHLSFGWAQRFCLGAHLARTEARWALTALLGRLATSRLENPVPSWYDRNGLRELRELWIRPA